MIRTANLHIHSNRMCSLVVLLIELHMAFTIKHMQLTPIVVGVVLRLSSASDFVTFVPYLDLLTFLTPP
jgi:hypothetical protein